MKFRIRFSEDDKAKVEVNDSECEDEEALVEEDEENSDLQNNFNKFNFYLKTKVFALVFLFVKFLKTMDKAVNFLIQKELQRQQNWLEMIASENYVSKQVLQAYANVFTNKYSEWYPWKRYYWGQEYVDRLEILTQYRALAIFDLIEGLSEDRKQGLQMINSDDYQRIIYNKLIDNLKWFLASS